MVEIRALGPADAEAYWNLRLQALRSEPLAFGAAVEEHLADGFEAVTARHLRNDPQGSFMLGAFQSGLPSSSRRGGEPSNDESSHRERNEEGLGVEQRPPLALVGIVGFVRSDRVKQRHTGGVIAMVVAPAFRGQGASRALMTALIARARTYEGLERITLDVWTGATAARSLYRAMGFVPFGLDRHALKVGDAYADLELMVLDLRPNAA